MVKPLKELNEDLEKERKAKADSWKKRFHYRKEKNGK